MIGCEQCQEYLDELSLRMEADLPQDVRGHLDECDTCRDVLADLQEAWALLPLTLEDEPVDAKVGARLMARIDAAKVREASPRWMESTLLKYGLAASILVASMSSLIIWSRHQLAVRHHATERARVIHEQLDRLSQWERGVGSTNLEFVSLQGVSTAPQVHGYLLHDVAGAEAYFFAFNLQGLEASRVYKLWIVGEDGEISASTPLEMDGSGSVSATVSLAGSVDIGQVLVTAELDGDAAGPSGDVHLRAAGRTR